MKKRALCLLLMLVMVLTLLPIKSFAATNQDLIWDYFKNQGFSNAGVAGIMGNLEAESGYFPNNLENESNNKSGWTDVRFTTAVDNGSISRSEFITSEQFGVYSGGLYGYGLAQWTDPSRKAGLYDFAKKTRKVSIADLNMQLDYMMQELKGKSSLLNLLKTTSDVSDACLQFHNIYEGSADNASQIAGRISRAKAVYKKYTGQEPDKPDNALEIEPGVYTIHSARDWNKVLDIAGNSMASGANIQLYDYDGSDVQKFRIVKEGDYYCIQSVYSGMWLDVSNPPTANRANVQLWKTNANNEEKWTFEDAEDGYVHIRNYYGNYVDLAGNSTENNTNIQLFDSVGSDSQRWKLVPVTEPIEITPGIYTIHSGKDWNKVLDIAGNSTQSGANIQLYDYTGTDVQKFRVVKNGDYYSIQSVYSDMWMDVASPAYETRANVRLWNQSTNNEEKWQFEDAGDGYVYIRNYYGNYIDIAGYTTDNNTNIQVYHAKSTNSQMWRLVAEPDPIEVPEGVFTIQSGRNENRVLDIQGNSTENKANIQLFDYTGTDVQKFRVIKNGDYYSIQSVYSGLWLDVAAPVTQSRSNVQLFNKNTNNEEKWQFEDAGNGYVYIRNYYGNYVDVAGYSSDNNTNIQVYHSKGSTSQQWRLLPELYTISINASGGTASTSQLKVKYGENCSLNSSYAVRDGYRLTGWNLYRPADNKWYVSDIGWCTEAELAERNLQKKVYAPESSTPLDGTWLKNATIPFIDSFEFCAVWTEEQHNHVLTAVTKVPATCTQDGTEAFWKCSDCGKLFSDAQGKNEISAPVVIKATGHEWDSGKVTKAATCTEAGVRTFTCKHDSSHTRTEAIPALGHDYKAVVTAPTCTEKGYTTHTCSRCGDSYVDSYVNALGHKTELRNAKAATCTTDGYTGDEICSTCGETIRKGTVIKATGHKWDSGKVTKEPTETADGVKTFTCTVCGETKTEAIPKLTHTHNYTEVVTPPTCTEQGYTTHTCAGCGESYVDSYVNALGHKTELRNAKAATCTTDGYTGDEICSTCGETIRKGTVIKATGHSWDSGKVTKEPTETAEGVKTFACTVCGETRTEAIPKLTPITPPMPNNPFVDVKQGAYYYDPVLWAVNHQPQITNGTSATTFSPDATCTRGQVVTFLWRANGCPEPKSTSNPFKDVASGAYYYKAVLWAVENGITNGTSATTFSPDAPCTRAHVVTFLWRSANKPAAGSANPFKDVKAGLYYTDAVLWAVSKNITNGTSATTFSPDSPCTRGQIVTFLYRYMME